MQGYCEKLVWNATKKLGPRSTLILATRFTKDYGLHKYFPPSILIEFLLSVPGDESNDALDKTKSEKSHRNDISLKFAMT